jgi:hypothetical protein
MDKRAKDRGEGIKECRLLISEYTSCQSLIRGVRRDS